MATIILSIAIVILSVWVFIIDKRLGAIAEVLLLQTGSDERAEVMKEIEECIKGSDSEAEAKKKVEKILKKHGLSADVEVIKKERK